MKFIMLINVEMTMIVVNRYSDIFGDYVMIISHLNLVGILQVLT